MKYILSIAAVLSAAAILIDPASAGGAVETAVRSCLEVIIPSLFAFTVLAVYLQSSGLYRTALKPLTLPLSRLLRIDEELCAVFILGNIGGYPVGARLLTSLVREGRLSRESAARMLCCCYGSGPSFVVSVAGMRVFGSGAAGGVLFLACFLSSLIIAVFVCRRGERITLVPAERACDLSAGCFISSVMGAARVMFTVCAVIAGFAAVSAVLEISGIGGAVSVLFERLGLEANSEAVFPAILEISRISELAPAGEYVYPLCGALLSFGGVCVVMQICALTAGEIPLKKFLLFRLPAAALCGVFSLVGLLLPSSAVETSAPAEIPARLFSVNAGLSLCVLIMCGMLLVSGRNEGGGKRLTSKINSENPLK